MEFSAADYRCGDSSDSDRTGDRASRDSSKTRWEFPEQPLEDYPDQYLIPNTSLIIKEEPASSDDEQFNTPAVNFKEDSTLLKGHPYSTEESTCTDTMSIINADGTAAYIERESLLEEADDCGKVVAITDTAQSPSKKVFDSSSQKCPGCVKWLSDLPEAKSQRAAGASNPFTCEFCGKSFL